MYSYQYFRGLFSGEPRNQRIRKCPDHKGDDSVHRKMGVGNRKIRKMPEQIGISEGFHRSLERSCKIEYNRHKIKGQGIAGFKLIPGSVEG